MRFLLSGLLAVGLAFSLCGLASAAGQPPKDAPKEAPKEEPKEPPKEDPTKTPAMKSDIAPLAKDIGDIKSVGIHKYADYTWMLVSSAFVLLMLPGLALFYGGMARRKHVLGTMMQTMVALGLVGVQWVVIGYSLAFGAPAIEASISSDDKGEPIKGGLVGYSPELVMLKETSAIGKTVDEVMKEKKFDPKTASDEQKKEAEEESAKQSRFKTFPNTNVPLYLHVMFQGMFAIITIALVSGAFAERVRFGPYLLFALLWTTVVYDPLAHMVWSYQWAYTDAQKVVVPLTGDPSQNIDPTRIAPAAGLLGMNGAIDFAGGTVVHIAAGFSGLAAVLVLRRRVGYGKQAFHPNSMVFTLIGAGLLWVGWFGFNGGSALFANGQAVSAFTVTQIAAAAAGMAWLLTEWIMKGKPTALGFASGVVAGLVAITPASGFVGPTGALVIGAIAGVACYGAVLLKGLLGYDDSLDAFGVHGVGGFIGAILTGVFVSLPLWAYGAEMPEGAFPGKTLVDEAAKTITYDKSTQIMWQLKAASISAIYAFVVTGVLILLIDKTIGFTVKPEAEAEGLDLAVHGEVGMDYGGGAPDEVTGAAMEPKAASTPPNGPLSKRFTIVVEGASGPELIKAWSELCKPSDTPPNASFKAVYPYFTTMSGTKFRFRGGDPVLLRGELQKLLSNILNSPVKTHVES